MGVRSSIKMALPALPMFAWKDSRCKRVCEGIHRSYPERGRGSAIPLTTSIIRKAVAALFQPRPDLMQRSTATQFERMFPSYSLRTEFVCIVIWLFISGSRVSELLHSAANRGLTCAGLRFIDEVSGATFPLDAALWDGPAIIFISKSKTDQRAAGAVKTICNVIGPGADLCPMRWGRAHFTGRSIQNGDRLFDLDYDKFLGLFKLVMSFVGAPGCSPHGTKSGVTTHLASSGVQQDTIARQMLWRTNTMVAHYSHRSLQESLRLQRLVFNEPSPSILLQSVQEAFRAGPV